MFNQRLFENSRPDGSSVLEVTSERPERTRLPFVPLKRTMLRGEVTGPLAALRLAQVFGYSREQCAATLEAVYRFPLPGDAAVTRVRVAFGDVAIEAALAERAEATATYEAAKREGRQATLLSRESPDVFTLQVAGIAPDQEISIETSYVQLARPDDAGWALRLPLTTAPRYLRSDELTARHAQGQPLARWRDPGHRFALDLRLQGAARAASPTHDLAVRREDDGVHVALRNGEVVPDRDLVLTWELPREERRPALRAWTHADSAAGHLYFLAAVTPPEDLGDDKVAPREVIVLVDHSGSMEGAKWEASDWAVKGFLAGLTPSDTFNLGLFHNTTRWFATKPAAASPEMVADATRFLEAHHDSGGTELGVALEQALGMARDRAERARHVVVITDAQVGDDGRILRLAETEWERADRRRISVLCIDAAPNSLLANELAERSGGVARFLTSAADEEDITTALDAMLAEWAQPAAAGLRLAINRDRLEAGERRLLTTGGHTSIDLGDLPRGLARWVAGRAALEGPGEVRLALLGAHGQEIASAAPTAEDHPALKALFGARRVLGLEFLLHANYPSAELERRLARLGYDPASLPPAGSGAVYAENARYEMARRLRALLVREALAYGLASAETAFVATRTERGQVVTGTVAVANALPHGWSEGFLSGAPAGMPHYAAMTVSAMPPPPAAPMPQAGQPYAQFEMATAPAQGVNLLRRLVGGRAREGAKLSAPPPPAAAPQGAVSRQGGTATLFSGTPPTPADRAVLFDSDAASGALPETVTFSRLRLHLSGGDTVDRRLTLEVYVGDMAAPRASVKLADLLRQGGARPLHIARRTGERVLIRLADPAGAWTTAAPTFSIALDW